MCFSVLSSFYCLQLLYSNILRVGESRSGGEVRGRWKTGVITVNRGWQDGGPWWTSNIIIGRGTGGALGVDAPHFFQNWKMCPFSEIKMPFF